MKGEEIKCPLCHKRGGVRARKDAYADHKIFISTTNDRIPNGDTHWHHVSTAVMDETQAYECFSCNEELDEKKLASFNNVIL